MLVYALPDSTAWAQTGADPLLTALREELTRNQQLLRMDDYPQPYYIAYQLLDEEMLEIGGKRGALYADKALHECTAYVEVRVGDYQLDNSEDEDPDLGSIDRFYPTDTAPLDSDPAALRHNLWLMTDFKYKQALTSYHTVRGKRVFANMPNEEESGSFTREQAVMTVEGSDSKPFDEERWRGLARRLSALVRTEPEIFDSYFEIKARKVVRRFVNTEGTGLRTQDTYYSVHFRAMTRAPDGMLLENSVDHYCRDEAHFPSEERLEKDVRRVMDELRALRAAPILDPYTGPAILEPEATGVFFHEAVGHRLEAHREKQEEEGQTFKGRLGQRVLPTFLNVDDDPTQSMLEGTQLNGWYRFDEEGVAAQKVALVEKGIFRSFLLGRRPLEKMNRSNGHGRSDGRRPPVARMGNLVVRGTQPLSTAELKKRLIAEAQRQGKPFGLRIGSIMGGSTNTSSYGYQAFKGTPRMVYKINARTGEETLVRGVEMVGTPLSSIDKIIATGDRYGVFNGYCGAESGWVPVSAVAPETLFREIELQRTVRHQEKPQILPPPQEGAAVTDR